MSDWKPTDVIINSECGGREGAFVQRSNGLYYTKKGWETLTPLTHNFSEYFRPIRSSDTKEDLVKRLRELAGVIRESPAFLTLHEAANVIEAGIKRDAQVGEFVDALENLRNFK